MYCWRWGSVWSRLPCSLFWTDSEQIDHKMCWKLMACALRNKLICPFICREDFYNAKNSQYLSFVFSILHADVRVSETSMSNTSTKISIYAFFYMLRWTFTSKRDSNKFTFTTESMSISPSSCSFLSHNLRLMERKVLVLENLTSSSFYC